MDTSTKPRKIILLSDGTGNSAAKIWRTNVWRTFEALDLSGDSQIAFYDDGVGTAAFKPLALLGGAFGFGLKRNLLNLYKFASRNYHGAQDEIFGFGFSRGAFTIRLLAGLIREQGLIKADNEAELDRLASAAYRAYRANNFETRLPWILRPETLGRAIRNLFLPSSVPKEKTWPGKDVKISFLGLWDTVAAYGLPVDEMTKAVGYYLWPWVLPSQKVVTDVNRVRHALSIDDQRLSFHPVMFQESNQDPLAIDDAGVLQDDNERVSQVWFAGSHSNVGGGYPDDSLALIPLNWMIEEATKAGLVFKSGPVASPQTPNHVAITMDKDGRMYDPRKGFGAYYRFGPRNIDDIGQQTLCRARNGPRPRIHHSVFARIKNRAHLYCPMAIPGDYDVVHADGKIHQLSDGELESKQSAAVRWKKQQGVWRFIWLRRFVYVFQIFLTAYTLGYPIYYKDAGDGYGWLTPLHDVIAALGSLLPHCLSLWVNAYAGQPAKFLICLGLFVGLFAASKYFETTARDDMDGLWRESLARKSLDDQVVEFDAIAAFNSKIASIFRFVSSSICPKVWAVVFVYLILGVLNHISFTILDAAGQTCVPLEKPQELRVGEILLMHSTRIVDELIDPKTLDKDRFTFFPSLPKFHTSSICQNMGVKVEKGRLYVIRFESTSTFYDGRINAEEAFRSAEAPFPLNILMMLATPLRRNWGQGWFEVNLRIGDVGGQDELLERDPSEPKYKINQRVKATRNGQLFLYVNDAVIGLPGLYDYFYTCAPGHLASCNHGHSRVVIEQIQN